MVLERKTARLSRVTLSMLLVGLLTFIGAAVAIAQSSEVDRESVTLTGETEIAKARPWMKQG